MLLGKLVERLRGLPLEACLRRYIAEPLGIAEHLMYRPKTEGRSIIPSCYDNAIEMQMCADRGVAFSHWRPMKTPVIGTSNDGNCHYYFHDVSGHAGIFSSADALVRLCQLYMRTDDPLFRQAQQTQPDSPGRGLGFQTGTAYPRGCGHTGFTGTSIYFSTERGIGAVALTNRLFYQEPSGQNLGEFRRALNEAVYDWALR